MAANQFGEVTILENPKKQSLSGKRHARLIDALFNIIVLKDIKTAEHCKNVAEYSYRLGRQIGLNIDQLKLVKDGAQLHDIGKVLVDMSALNKRGKLNERELLMVRNHPIYGMRFLTGFHVPDEITDIAWHHHERWDGKGYPDGMKGEDIPKLVRVVSVCDTIDAMASNRPYRPRLTKEEIIDQLSKAKGTQLDPEITDVAVQMIENGRLDLYC